MTIACIEKDGSKYWGQIWFEGDSIFAHSVYNKDSEEAVLAVMRNWDPEVKVLPKADFYLQWWRVFFLERTNNPEAPWEELVALARSDPLITVVRDRVRRTHAGEVKTGSKWEAAEWANNRGSLRARPYVPRPRPAGSVVTRSPQAPPIPAKKDHECDKFPISPVALAKLVGVPPQYIYNLVYHKKVQSWGDRPKQVCKICVGRRYGKEFLVPEGA